jgi:4-diphosphocytidyl-2-C-methyl-D-erythritol kinase
LMSRVERCIRAPAKLNLTLRVIGRRSDGYHLLESLVVPISLCDELRIVFLAGPALDVRVQSNLPALASDDSNLAHRAAVQLLLGIGRSATVEIDLVKRIPIGSGLGGGSSDAAAVLLALNDCLGRPLSRPELAQLGLDIGADVPFFVYGTPARVGGIGEVVEPVQLPGPIHAVVCGDGFPLATASVFARVPDSLTKQGPDTRIRDFVAGRASLENVLVNDLEAVAAEIHPPILALKAGLVALGASAALMTGSGSALFGVWPDAASAGAASRQLRAEGWWAVAVEDLAASPALTSGWWAVAKR